MLPNKSVEFYCDSTVNVTANFEANWRQWGKIDFESITQKPDLEEIYATFERANLGFTPLSGEVYVKNPLTGQMMLVEDKKGIFNPAYDKHLAIVGDGFNALPHWDTLNGVFGDILKEGFIPSRFLCYDRGARMIAQFVIPEKFYAAGREHIGYVCVYNAIDGSKKAMVGFTMWTPICANTRAAALQEIKGSGMGAKHTKNMESKLQGIQEQLFNVRKDLNNYLAVINKLFQTPVNSGLTEQFIEYLMPKVENSTSKATDNRRSDLAIAIAQTNTELAINSPVTAYDLFGGVTRYIADRSQKRDGFEQLEYVTVGVGNTMADKAQEWLVKNA